MILIAGDSYGCGEWSKDIPSIVVHKGLEQYLVDDGKEVVNLSKGGCSNFDTAERLSIWFDLNQDRVSDVECVIVFQTEYSRDFKKYQNEQWNISKFTDIADRWIGRFYARLSQLAEKNNCDIYIIGGISDTLWFDNMSDDYPGCHLLCQSLTNLLLYQQSKVDTPVLSWYWSNAEDFLQQAKSVLPSSEIVTMVDLIAEGRKRETLVGECPEMFYPDGKHPNRQAHLMLYNFIKESKIL